MNISVIALDLDGTLLGTDKQLSERNLNAVLRCGRSGKKIIIATARPPRSVRELLPRALLDMASFVFYNGAVVRDAGAGIDEHIPIERMLSGELLDYCSSTWPEACISVEVNDRWYASREMNDIHFFHPTFKPVLQTIEQLKAMDATKILLTGFAESEPLLERFGGRAHVVLTDQGTLLQLMNKSVSKQSGIRRLCRHYGIPDAGVMAFGDDWNDLDMLAMAGYAIAMGNAVPMLKELADEVTASNDEDGVALVLERLLG